MINVIAQFETTLASGISKDATSGVLVSNLTGDNDGATIPNGDYGVVIDERNSKREYAIITINGYDFTFVKRGLSFIDGYTEKNDNKFDHRKGAIVKIVTHPILPLMVKAFNGELALGGVMLLPSVRSISNSRHIVDKEYVDAIVSTGVPALAVSDNGGITVNINSGVYLLNGVLNTYAGVSNQSLANNATNYIQLIDGVLDINTNGFTDYSLPLAQVVCSSGDITSLIDKRPFMSALDLKPDYGIGIDSAGIFIDLATNSGLGFSNGKLKAMVKTNGGVLIDDNGFYVDSTKFIPASGFSGPVVSNNLRLSSDSQVANSNSTPTKKKEIVLPFTGTYRIKYDYAVSGTNGGSFANIYRNGLSVGTERSRNRDSDGTSFVTASEDLVFNAGDALQLYLWTNGNGSSLAQNFRIYYDFGTINPLSFNGQVLLS